MYSALYKGKGDKCECRNSKDLYKFVECCRYRLYGRVLIKRVRAGTERATGEEHVDSRALTVYVDSRA